MSYLSVRELIHQGAAQLSAVSDTAKLDVQVLLCAILEKELTFLHTWPETLLSSTQLQKYHALFQRRLNGEPIAYIVGVKEFWSLPLKVSPATLIPRADTEVLVEAVLAYTASTSEILNCLDLGTGTGAIALALASERPKWHIEAVDFNDDAVVLAKENAQALQLSQVSIYQSDWFSAILPTQKFNIIVTNPPYIDETDFHLEQGDVRFEPSSALTASNHGLTDIEFIISNAVNYLSAQGAIFIEHGFEQAIEVNALFDLYGYHNIVTVKDYGGNDRITWAVKA